MHSDQVNQILDFITELYGSSPVPLHRPFFSKNEAEQLEACISSNFVSTAGPQVDVFEKAICEVTNAKFAIAVNNGTAALELALRVVGVSFNDEVLTQPFTFVGTCNAISQANAHPYFLDIDSENLGLCPNALKDFLINYAERRDGEVWNKQSNRRIAACLPVHLFGFSGSIDEIASICDDWTIPLVEDAAESLGTTYKQKHLGTFGKAGILSFNGNKIITTGGGGAILTDNVDIADRARHLASTARVSDKFEYDHDCLGYNYRMPALNASLGIAQLKSLSWMLAEKHNLHHAYSNFFKGLMPRMMEPDQDTVSNYWLNTILFSDIRERNDFLAQSFERKIFARPAWKLMSELPMYSQYRNKNLENSVNLQARLVNLPSSVPTNKNSSREL